MMGDMDRNELDAVISSLRDSVSNLVARQARIEHQLGHLLECFRAAQRDDTERWNKHFLDLRKRFEHFDKRIKPLETPDAEH